MTNQWFRSWHGAPTDPKWLGIARKAGVAPGIVAAIVWALLDRASQASVRGSIAGYDADGLACFMGCEVEQVESVIAIMHEKGILTESSFTGWEKHQPKREDSSTERVKAHRERNETQCNATQPAETLDTDTDTEKKDKPAQAREPDRFDEFWEAYPKRVAKGGAKKAWKAAIIKTSPDVIIAAARVFSTKQIGDAAKYTPYPASWLNDERWLDENTLMNHFIGQESTTTVFVPEDSPAFKAWGVFKGRSPPAVETRIDGRIVKGWRFPTEYPPSREAAA